MPEIQAAGGLFFVSYTKSDLDAYDIKTAASIIEDDEHLGDNLGNYWSGTHPAFNIGHGIPFVAVIDLWSGKILATDPIPEALTAQEILEEVQKANE